VAWRLLAAALLAAGWLLAGSWLAAGWQLPGCHWLWLLATGWLDAGYHTHVLLYLNSVTCATIHT